MRARLVTAAAVATATMLPAFLALGAPAAYAGKDDSGNNKGDIKVSTVGGPADNSDEAHVGCSFDIQWYGFERSTSTVSFEQQGGSANGLHIAVASGTTTVELGDPKSGSELNTIRTYTLSFTGADPQNDNGYHVKVTAETVRSDDKKDGKKGDTKSKVFWSKCDRADVPPTDPGTGGGTTDPGTGGGTTDPGTGDDGTTDPGTGDDGTTDPGTGDDGTGDPGTGDDGTGDDGTTDEPTPPFSWDWHYDAPTCTGVTVVYPANIPDHQANDANIRFESNLGQFTMNFHNNDDTWSGTHVFDFLRDGRWPAGITWFDITWVQVGGTNYHWQGDVGCVVEGSVVKGRTDLSDFDAGSTTVKKGSSPGSDLVEVGQTGDQDLELQMLAPGSARGFAARSASTWTTVKAIRVADNGTARVTYPKLTKKGTYKFRLSVAGSDTVTGNTSRVLTVRVR